MEEIGIADHSALERFVKAGMKFSLGKRRQDGWVDEHGPGLVESSQKIFSGAQVHACLAANRGIQLGQHSGGNLDHVHAAHI